VKTLTVRLPAAIANEIEAESRRRHMSKSDLVRERLASPSRRRRKRSASLDAIADLIGAVDSLPPDLSRRRKYYLAKTGYGEPRRR
jgi:ribbon-helix-helix CopG family protein